jgi:hypothetical protein
LNSIQRFWFHSMIDTWWRSWLMIDDDDWWWWWMVMVDFEDAQISVKCTHCAQSILPGKKFIHEWSHIIPITHYTKSAFGVKLSCVRTTASFFAIQRYFEDISRFILLLSHIIIIVACVPDIDDSMQLHRRNLLPCLLKMSSRMAIPLDWRNKVESQQPIGLETKRKWTIPRGYRHGLDSMITHIQSGTGSQSLSRKRKTIHWIQLMLRPRHPIKYYTLLPRALFRIQDQWEALGPRHLKVVAAHKHRRRALPQRRLLFSTKMAWDIMKRGNMPKLWNRSIVF